MSDFLALGGTIAVWLAVSIALWLARRLWIRSRQNKRLGHAAAAVEQARAANRVFDAIRSPTPPEDAPEDARTYLRNETHALLNRIQQQGDYFDRVNGLRVTIQAALGVDNHKGLSDILDLRRDLWAASEIVLVEDPAQFGRTFAGEGTFERFRAEAVRTLFKLPETACAGEDVIDLRIALAVQEAESFAAELTETIAAARERDRLPTPAELAAYPVAWVRKIPPALAAIGAFAAAFYAHASETSRRVRGSEAVTRGAARIRQIGEDWPQRLSDGFQRASSIARENAAPLRQHYDFLAAAHDFKGKYQAVIQRAPELSERSRQFLARLELAERSERLRLTSANAAIWTARKSVEGLAHTLAFLRNTYATVQGTAPYALASAALAPGPVRGRRVPAFRSYRLALGANGLREPAARPVIVIEPAPPPAAKAARKAAPAPAKKKAARPEKSRKVAVKRPAASEKPKLAVPPVKAAKAAKPKVIDPPVKVVKVAKPDAAKPEVAKKSAATESRIAVEKKASGERRGLFGLFGGGKDRKASAKIERTAVAPPQFKSQTQEKPPVQLAPVAASKSAPTPTTPAIASDPSPEIKLDAAAPAKTTKPKLRREQPKPEAPQVNVAPVAEPETEAAAPESPEVPAKAIPAQIRIETSEPPAAPIADTEESSPQIALSEGASSPLASATSIEGPESEISVAPPMPETTETGETGKGGTFFSRLFARRKSAGEQDVSPSIETAPSSAYADDEEDYDDAFIDELVFDDPIAPPPSLLDKLSSLGETDEFAAFDEAADDEDDAEADLETSEVELAGDDADDFGPLTQSLMELQVNMKPQTPQIKAFPWLRQ